MSDGLEHMEDNGLTADIDRLKAEIAASQERSAQSKVTSDSFKEQLTPLQEEEELLRIRLAEIKRKTSAARELIEAERRKQREEESARVEMERKLRMFLSEQALRDEWDKLSDLMDSQTINAAWREFAYPHQIDGAKRLATAKRAILGDKRGLGKTLTSLCYLDMAKANRVIIFTPRDVAGNFLREVQKWTPDRKVINMVGMDKMKRDFIYPVLDNLDKFTVILNYEAWRKDLDVIDHLVRLQFDTIIMDEAHNLKSEKSMGFKGMRKLVYALNKCPHCGAGADELTVKRDHNGFVISVTCEECFMEDERGTDMFCSVQNVLPMSGTTIINRPQDIWTLLYLVDRYTFGNRDGFLSDFATRSSYDGRWTFTWGGQERLLKKLGKRFVGRTPDSAGVKFPPQEMQIHRLTLTREEYPEQYKVLEEIYKYGVLRFGQLPEQEKYISRSIVEILRRRQGVVWPAGIILKDDDGNEVKRLDAYESIKMDKAMELIETITQEEEEPVVIFSKFKESLKELERRCEAAGISAIRYDGDLPEHMRQEVQLDFDIKTAPKFEDKRWKVFLGQYDSAATGLNLTAARQMVLTDRDWSPAREDQASGRIQRLDSTRDSIVHVLHVETLPFEKLGIDEFMAEIMDIKAEAIGGMDNASEKQEALFRKLMGED